MPLLIESIHLLDGQFSNLPFHQERMNRAWKELFGIAQPWLLSDVLTDQQVPSKGLFKCRLIYDTTPKSVEFAPYLPKPVRSLKLIQDDTITYDHKFENRKRLEELFSQRGDADEILIIRNGKVTDTSFSNIAFKKQGQWFTPTNCMLKGTMRQKLIEEGTILVIEIDREDIPRFESFKLINAMVRWDSPEVVTTMILS